MQKITTTDKIIIIFIIIISLLWRFVTILPSVTYNRDEFSFTDPMAVQQQQNKQKHNDKVIKFVNKFTPYALTWLLINKGQNKKLFNIIYYNIRLDINIKSIK